MPEPENHELRNRLSTALGYARLLSETDLAGEQRAWVEEIIRACDDAAVVAAANLGERLGLDTDASVRDVPASAMPVLERALTEFVDILTDRHHGPATIKLSPTPPTGFCSTCGQRIEDDLTGLRLRAGHRQVRAPVTDSSATDLVHAAGGHVVMRTGTGDASVDVFLPAGQYA